MSVRSTIVVDKDLVDNARMQLGHQSRNEPSYRIAQQIAVGLFEHVVGMTSDITDARVHISEGEFYFAEFDLTGETRIGGSDG